MIIGHERILRFLERSITVGRIAHAYGFFGPQGVGKSMVARLFARSLLCERGLSLSREECHCPSCRAFESYRHPDVRIVVPQEKELGIDEVRELSSFLGLTPFAGKRKVILIEDAERMTPQAANSFLKTLEDPPLDSLLIFISSSPEQIFETLRSRLLILRFARLRAEALKAVLPDVKSQLPDTLLAGRPGLALEWERTSSRALPAVQKLLAADFPGRFSILSRKGSHSDLELSKFLELAALLFRDAALNNVSEGSHLSARDLAQHLRKVLELLRLSRSLNLSPKLTRDVFLFTAPQLAVSNKQ